MRMARAAVSVSSVAIGGADRAVQRCWNRAQSVATASNCGLLLSSQGMNSGRAGSPSRSSARLASNWRACRTAASWSPVLTDSDSRKVCMRMRPASLRAAAPPSSCQETHTVNPMRSNASAMNGEATKASLVPRPHVVRVIMEPV